MEPIWPSFRLDPRDPQHAALRVSDADRALVSKTLAEAYAGFQLTAEEYDQRESANLAAVTLGELTPLLSDLERTSAELAPVSVGELRRTAARQHARDAGVTILVATVPFALCLLIWLLAGADGYFWPIWALIPTVLATAVEVVGTPAAIRSKARRLVREAGLEEPEG